MKNQKHNGNDLVKVISIFFCIVLMIFTFFTQQKKRHYNEAKILPFLNVQLENVADGRYENTTVTSFMQLTVLVTVKDHQLTAIKIIENKGSRGQKIESMIPLMLEKNTAIVSVPKGDEIGGLVFISCVDGALAKGNRNSAD